MKRKWIAVGVVVPFVIAYFIASAIGRPVHLDPVTTVSSAGPTSSRWYLIIGKGPNQLRYAIPGTFKDLRTTANQGPPPPVLIANQPIPKGTPGSLVATNRMYAATTLPWKEVEDDAISAPSYLCGRVSVVDIFPGQHLTETDFDRPPHFNGGGSNPTPVLVARQLIPKGTPGPIVANNGMYAATTLPAKEVEVGAIAKPMYLRGRASVVDICPGQQITETNFK